MDRRPGDARVFGSAPALDTSDTVQRIVLQQVMKVHSIIVKHNTIASAIAFMSQLMGKHHVFHTVFSVLLFFKTGQQAAKGLLFASLLHICPLAYPKEELLPYTKSLLALCSA